MNRLVQSSGRLSVAAEAVIKAPPEAVWALVADAARYPQWGPWSAAGYRGAAGHAPGAVYWLRSAGRAYGRYVTTVERVEEIDQCRRIVYTVLGGIPVRGYRAEVTLTAVPGGTRVSWAASWDKTLGGRLVQRGLREFYPAMLASLTTAATSQEANPEPLRGAIAGSRAGSPIARAALADMYAQTRIAWTLITPLVIGDRVARG